MQPRIYTYKITFEEIPHWYWGVHKEKKYGETYLGSPVTHKWMWDFYTPRIQILEFFPYTDEGWKEANLVEDRLIKPDLNNPLCLNEGCNLHFSIDAARKGGSVAGNLTFSRKTGAHGRSTEQMKLDGKRGGETSASLGFGFRAPGRAVSVGKTGGEKTVELGVGCHDPEYRASDKYKEDRKKAASVANAQVWKSVMDGFTGRACVVAKHNKDNGWDPNARVRLS